MVKEGNDTMAKNPNRIKEPLFDRVFYIVTFIILLAILVIIIYPLWFVLMASCSDAQYVNNGDILLYPKGFTTLGYERTIANMNIWIGYANTILYTVGGTVVGTFCTVVAGYALSRKDLPGHGIIMKLFVFTMYFQGGMIPFYIIINNLGLMDTRFLMIIISCITVYNIILVRSYFANSLPHDLFEAASIDGCSNARFIFQIAIPLSKAIIAVIALYLVVGYWNSYFTALIYLQDSSKKPLQLFLREILLVSTQSMQQQTENAEAMAEYQRLLEVIKYAVIVVSTLPVMCIYPFLQKYFVQGVMIGSLKG